MPSRQVVNLAAVLAATGLSQAEIVRRLAARGVAISRPTVSRWTNGTRDDLSAAEPALLAELLAECGAATGTRLVPADLDLPEAELAQRLRLAREGSYLMGGLVARCREERAARRFGPQLAGFYKGFMVSMFDPARLRMALLQLEEDDDVAMRCRLHVLRNNRLADSRPTIEDESAELILAGRVLFQPPVCHIVLETQVQPSMAAMIVARLPATPPPWDSLDSIITVYGSPAGAAVLAGRFLMVRTSADAFAEMRRTGAFGELPADHPEANWVISRLTRGLSGPHVTIG